MRAVLLALAALATTPAAAAPPAPKADAVTVKRLYAILLRPGPKWKPGKPFAEQGLREHFFYWKRLFDAGKVVSAGPLGVDRGLVLLYAADQAEADATLRADPAIVSGVFVGEAIVYAPGIGRGQFLRN